MRSGGASLSRRHHEARHQARVERVLPQHHAHGTEHAHNSRLASPNFDGLKDMRIKWRQLYPATSSLSKLKRLLRFYSHRRVSLVVRTCFTSLSTNIHTITDVPTFSLGSSGSSSSWSKQKNIKNQWSTEVAEPVVTVAKWMSTAWSCTWLAILFSEMALSTCGPSPPTSVVTVSLLLTVSSLRMLSRFSSANRRRFACCSFTSCSKSDFWRRSFVDITASRVFSISVIGAWCVVMWDMCRVSGGLWLVTSVIGHFRLSARWIVTSGTECLNVGRRCTSSLTSGAHRWLARRCTLAIPGWMYGKLDRWTGFSIVLIDVSYCTQTFLCDVSSINLTLQMNVI